MTDWIIIIIYLVLIGLALFYIIFFSVTLINTYNNRKNQKEFLKLLSNGIENGTLTNWDDLTQLFEIVYDIPFSDKNSRIMTYNLRQFMKQLIAGISSLSPDENIKWKTTVDTFLKMAEVKNPYEELSGQERDILQNIETNLNNGNNQEVKNLLKNLSTLMIAKQSEINKHVKKNKWSFPFAVLGIILTVIFGIFPLILSFSR